MSTDARRKLADVRGQVYLDYARKYLESGDIGNARSTAEEGLLLTCGPFYIAVRDQLEDFIEMLNRIGTTAATTTQARVVTEDRVLCEGFAPIS